MYVAMGYSSVPIVGQGGHHKKHKECTQQRANPCDVIPLK